MANQFSVRAYEAGDRDALLALAPRLSIGIAPWRRPEGYVAAARKWIEGSIGNIGPEAAVFVAADTGNSVVGFVSVSRDRHFSGDVDAYVGELVVGEAAEGQGVGRSLLEAAERWATDRGYERLVLDTGWQNTRARDFYAHRGYREESVKLVKVLGEE